MYPNGASYDSAGAAWSTSYNWRLKKCAGPATAGFSNYVPGQSAGLVPAAGLPLGFTTDSNLGTISSATLSQYYEGAFAVPFTGARSPTDTFRYVRIGKNVTLAWNDDVGATCAASAFNATSGTVPSALRPSGNINLPIFVQDNASAQSTPGYLLIQTNGAMQLGKNNNSGAFTVSAFCGYYAGSITYPINFKDNVIRFGFPVAANVESYKLAALKISPQTRHLMN